MTANMAWKAGKGAFQNFGGKGAEQDPTIKSVDHSHYRGTLIESRKENGQLVFTYGKLGKKHRKNTAYYEYKGIPEKDAKILSRVVVCAKFLDNGISVLGYKVGVSTFIELIPAGGDVIGTGLSFLLVVLPASCVSSSPEKWATVAKMVFNLTKDFTIGLIPFAGDWIDTVKKYNVRNADAVEKMLLKRAEEAAKKGRDAEQVGRTIRDQRVDTNGHHLAVTNEHHGSQPPRPPPKYIAARDQHADVSANHLAATNGHHDSEPTRPAQRYITANDLRQDPRLAPTASAPLVSTQPKKSGGNFFRRRGGPQSGQKVGKTSEEVVIVRPSRPEHSTREHDGHF